MVFIMDNWKELLGLLTLIVGIYKHIDARKNELAWKKTETVFNLGYTFDSDARISSAVMLLEGRESNKNISDFYESDGSPKDSEYGKELADIDQMLNFLDRVANALDAKTLTMKEVAHFGYYFDEISKIPTLYKYCETNGFEDVAKIAHDI